MRSPLPSLVGQGSPPAVDEEYCEGAHEERSLLREEDDERYRVGTPRALHRDGSLPCSHEHSRRAGPACVGIVGIILAIAALGLSGHLPYGRGKVAVLIRGESFRFGEQHTRSIGAPESVGPQFEAVESQVRYLLAPLQKAGFSVRIYLATSRTGNASLDSELRARYARSRGAAFAAEALEEVASEDRSTEAVALLYNRSATRRRESADYFIFLRPDLILKQDVFPLWHAQRSKAAFTFPEHCTNDLVKGCRHLKPGHRCLRVADMIVSVPRAIFLTMWQSKLIQGLPGQERKYIFTHFLYRDLLNNGVPEEQISFWISTGYDADPRKDANPLYRLAGRSEYLGRVLPCRSNSSTP